MSLLLTFFVLLLSFSSTQTAKFEAIAGAMKNGGLKRSTQHPGRMENVKSKPKKAKGKR
jgi:flagellar motor protein MotB